MFDCFHGRSRCSSRTCIGRPHRCQTAANSAPPCLQVKGTFRAFLTDAAAFYKDLIIRLQQEQGDVGAVLALGGQVVIEQGLLAAREGAGGCRVSVYRCLVCLGDLARWA